MPNREDELLREAIDGIEPSEGAKERMLANIKRKAASAANETEPVRAEQQPASEPAEEKSGKKSFSRIIRLWIPVAAAVIVLILGWGFYRNRIKPKANDDRDITAGSDQKERKDLSTLKEEASTEEVVRSLLGEFPKAPAGVSEVRYFRFAAEAGGMEFSLNGHRFRLTVMGAETAGKYFVPAADNELRESWERDGTEYVLVNMDNVDMTLWDAVIDGLKQ